MKMMMKISECFMFILFLCPLLTRGKKLEVASKIGVTDGEELFALSCPGISSSFSSVVWLLHEENTLVGAGVNYNHQKYRYHASNGDLAIRNVGYGDAGIYRCIVTYLGDTAIDLRHETKAVELLVSQPYRDLWEEEYKSNMIRGLVAAAIAASLVTIACTIYKYRWREPKYMNYSEELQLVNNGLDNLGMEFDQQRKNRARSSSLSSVVGIEPLPTVTAAAAAAAATSGKNPTTAATVHISHI